MTSNAINSQREGIQIPFVTQHPPWPDAAAFAPHAHPHQPIQYSGHLPMSHDEGARPPVSSVDFAWSGYRPSSSDQPMQHFQGHNPFCHQHGKPDHEPPMPGHSCACPQHQNNAVVPPTVPTPPPSDGSPHPAWMPMMPPSDPDADHVAKRVKYDWFETNTSLVLRPDGVRKKNAKFEIPDERNLDTLDSLIKHAKSEDELKELKMQKRLLRNREAALHSRQKKKSHTEWLERERDTLSSQLYKFQQELTGLRIRIDDHQRDKSSWQEKLSHFEQQNAALQREKAMLLEQHTRETGKLNVEVKHLQDQLQSSRRSSAVSPTSVNSGNYSSDESVAFSNSSNYGNNEWDGNYELIDGCLDPGKLRHSGDSGPNILVH